MKKILVTGGAGFLGSYICERLIKMGHKVFAIDMADSSKVEHLLSNRLFTFLQGSILDNRLLEHAIEKCDMVFHLAAVADPKRYVQEPLLVLEIDLQGALNVLNMTARRRIKVIFASTSEVYGKNPRVPWKEDDDRLIGPTKINRWCYATAKSAGEHYCYAYHQQEGMPFVILRFFNVYGPRLDYLGSGRVISVFLERFLKNQPVQIHGDGKQTRSFSYIEDVVEGVMSTAFSRKAENEVFNIGSDREISILELAKMMKTIGEFTSPIEFVPHKQLYGNSYEDIPRRVPNLEKIKKFVGWEATTSLEEGLKKTIRYYKEKGNL